MTSEGIWSWRSLTPPAHLARHLYRHALMSADEEHFGQMFLGDDREDSPRDVRPTVCRTPYRVRVFEERTPDGTPRQRWHYDRKGNPLHKETWRQDYDGSWKWMNLEWIAAYTYDQNHRLVEETYYHSADVYGETWVHHYDENGLRRISECWDLEKTRLRYTEGVEALQVDERTRGWIITGPLVHWKILYDEGPYEIDSWTRADETQEWIKVHNPYWEYQYRPDGQEEPTWGNPVLRTIKQNHCDSGGLPEKTTSRIWSCRKTAPEGAAMIMTGQGQEEVLATYKTELYE